MAEIAFTGNLGADSKISFTRSGSPVLNFSVCDTKLKRDGNGGWEKVTEQWFEVELWGSMGEFLADQLLKGVKVKVYGTFYARQYDGKNGRGTALDVKASAVEVLTSHKDRQKIAGQNQPPYNAGAFPTPEMTAADPWATPAPSNHVGWGSGPDGEPPF